MVRFSGIPEDLKRDQTEKSFVTRKSSKSGSTGASTLSSGKSNASTYSEVELHKEVTFGKWIFVTLLLVVAGLLGWMGYFLLERAEQELWVEQYESMTERAIETVEIVAVSLL